MEVVMQKLAARGVMTPRELPRSLRQAPSHAHLHLQLYRRMNSRGCNYEYLALGLDEEMWRAHFGTVKHTPAVWQAW